jgi:hypothetical protein
VLATEMVNKRFAAHGVRDGESSGAGGGYALGSADPAAVGWLPSPQYVVLDRDALLV